MIGIVPSRYETFSVVALEMMAYGIPTVVFDIDNFDRTSELEGLFSSFYQWIRTNLIIGIVMQFLEKRGIDMLNLDDEYCLTMFEIIQTHNPSLTDENWPYHTMLPL